MRPLRHSPILLTLVASTLGACTLDQPVAPSPAAASGTPAYVAAAGSTDDGFRFDNRFPITVRVTSDCAAGGAGERLDISGEIHVRGHLYYTHGGTRRHSHLTGTFTGIAVGYTTGDVYDASSREHEQYSTKDGDDGIADAGTAHYRGRTTLVHRQTGAQIVAETTVRFVQAADGRILLDQAEVRETCR